MAPGARPGAVLRLVIQSGMRPVLTGGAIGIAAAVAIARLLSNTAAEVNPRDPVVFGASLAAILVAALLAMFLPALRAAKIQPMAALRHE